jgi:hypothetical protein
MKQMGLLRMRAAISFPAQMEQRRFFWWGHDTVGNKPLNFIVSIRVVDPDWIRIQSGQWIRIRNPDTDPGGQNDPQK